MNAVLSKRTWKRIVLGSLAMLALVITVATVWLYRSVPPVDGSYVVTGIDADVTIRFDVHQRPYVRAQTLDDALFAEGWLHAHHRIWQMEMFRRAGAGRLSELLGASMLDSDKELWRMGVPQLADRLAANASPAMSAHVDSYVQGVNAALEVGVSRPPEFLLLQTSPAPWTPRDVYALGALMVFQSSGNAGNELLRLALMDELDEERAEIFLPEDGHLADFPYVVSTSRSARRSETAGGRLTKILDRRLAIDPGHNPRMPRFALGSNGWVVAPERTVGGAPLFAFDSHDALGLPNLFYEIHLFFGEGQQIRGWSVAGLPGVINGYNEGVAWGFTNIGDTQDLFLETRSDSDPSQFKEGDAWYTAETETVEIAVAGRDAPESLTIVRTRNGPLISEDPPISLRWTIQDLGDRGIDAILKYNRALNCREFSESLDDFAGPSLNATFADIDGNIGFRTAGMIPIRGRGNGLFPLEGERPENRWQGMVPVEAMPKRFNPEAGFLAAANARVAADGEGPLVSADNAPGYRIRRLHDVLSSRNDFKFDDMRALQIDWYDSQAALLMPTMIAAVDRASLDELGQRSLSVLSAWQPEFQAAPDSAAAILFQAWYRELAIEVFQPALSRGAFEHLLKNNYPLNHALDRLILKRPDSSWWRGERGTLITESLAAAVREIRHVQGDDLSTWRLDRMHRVKLEHELGKAVPQLGWFFNAQPAPWGGGPATLGRARYRYDRPFDATAGATMRVVGELKDPSISMSGIIPGGQSGHPLSSHYRDQYPHWLAGRLLPIAPSPEEVTGGSTQLLTPN